MKATCLATTIVAAMWIGGTAHAALLQRGLDEPFTFDFRAGSATPGSVSGRNGSFTAEGRMATLRASHDISRTTDGLGISSNEGDSGRNVENTIGRTESLSIDFDSSFELESIGITNAGSFAFVGINVQDTFINVVIGESVLNFSSQSFTAFDPPGPEFNTDGEGRTTLSFANLDEVNAVTSIIFTTEQFGSYAVAGISEVPLPASAWLLASVLGALGAIGRYARTRRSDAAKP